MTGRVIFLTMTALPESDAQTSLVLKAEFCSKMRRIDSATAPASMMAPSTMESGGTGAMPKAATRYPLPAGFNSTALTALDPMSSPTTLFDFRNMYPQPGPEPVALLNLPSWLSVVLQRATQSVGSRGLLP